MRIPTDVVESLKALAPVRGFTGYQTLLKSYISEGLRRDEALFEYADSWLDHEDAFPLDPANLPLQSAPFARTSAISALPGALRDTAPDRWGQLLVRRAFRDSAKAQSIVDEVAAAVDNWQRQADRLGMNRADTAVYASAFTVSGC